MRNPYEPILKEIASGLLETAETKPNFSDDAFLDSILIFQTVFMDKVYDCQEYDKMEHKQRLEMVNSAGNNLRELIKTYTGIDTIELVENYNK